MSPSQIDRPYRVKTPLGDDALLLDSFQGVEAVSDPFRFLLRVLSPDPNVDMQGLLTKPVVLTFPLEEDKERHIHGNICRVKLLGAGEDGMAAYELEVVPWFWFLNLFTDCHIFQNKSVPDIVCEVFKNRGYNDYLSKLTGTYPPREYCVQYRETDFNFVSRLLEQEGICYFFAQSQDKHTMILADDNSSFADFSEPSTVNYQFATGGRQDSNTVNSLEAEYCLQPGTATHTDYDFTKPNSSLYTTLLSSQKGEVYDYPGKFTTKDDGDRYARIRLEEFEVGISKVRGESNCMEFASGYKFTLDGYYRDDSNVAYTLLSVEHQGRNASYRSGEMVSPFEYKNRFEAIPNTVPFRPSRRANKPVIDGTQTAVVVGKSGEEIWTDQYGRVIVQFFWDRVGVSDEKSSCWIRVSQGWAGKQWGFICIPRIGQEVVVSFLEGDPDRPLITGSVYNGVEMPPYGLPDTQNQSTWKSMSTKGGGGFNELRFDDTKGSEQIFVHGEKDMDMRIKNDRREWIGQDRHLFVTRDKLEKTGRDSHLDLARDQIEKIGRDHHMAITGKEAIAVTGSHSLSVTGDVIEEFKANHSSQVSQNLYLKAAQVVIEGQSGITLKVGGNFITINSGSIAIKGSIVLINSGGAALSGSPGSLVSPLSPTAAAEAADATPGAVTTVTPGTPGKPASMPLDQISPAAPSKKSAASDAPTHDPASPENQSKTSFIEIKLAGQDGSPVAGEPYQVTLADGTTVADGTLDANGFARVDNIDPGSCKVTFPQRDKTTLKPS